MNPCSRENNVSRGAPGVHARGRTCGTGCGRLGRPNREVRTRVKGAYKRGGWLDDAA